MVPTLSWRGGVSDVKDAVAAAKQADVVVAVVGFTREIEGEEMSGRALPEGSSAATARPSICRRTNRRSSKP